LPVSSKTVDSRSLDLASYAQELVISLRAAATPLLSVYDNHAHGHHTGVHAQTVESEDPPEADLINESLHTVGNGEVDARRTDCEDDDELSGDLTLCQYTNRIRES